jgi:hypothetical protein
MLSLKSLRRFIRSPRKSHRSSTATSKTRTESATKPVVDSEASSTSNDKLQSSSSPCADSSQEVPCSCSYQHHHESTSSTDVLQDPAFEIEEDCDIMECMVCLADIPDPENEMAIIFISGVLRDGDSFTTAALRVGVILNMWKCTAMS